MSTQNFTETIKAEEKDLSEIAKKILKTLEVNNLNLLALIGNLGAGKTTLTQKIAAELKIPENIQSPTFILMNEHAIPNSSQSDFRKLFHIDAYRIENIEEVDILDLDNLRSDKSNLVIIEWANNIQEKLKGKYLQVNITEAPNAREFKFEIKQ